ncbi:C40 family peptidase [Nocardia sp. X0981]
MTSAEVGPYPVQAETESEEPVEGAPETGTPWAIGERRRWGAGQNNGSAPGTPGAPAGQSQSPTATPASNTGAGPSAPASAAPPPAAPVAAAAPQPAPAAAVPAQPHQAAPPAEQPPPAAAPPAADPEREEPDPLVDPETLAQLAPMAMMAGTALLPMIGSALSGLLGGGGAGGAGTGGGAGASAGEVEGAGMSPEAQRAMKVLNALEAMYGEGEPANPEVKELREKLAGSGSAGTGEGPAMVKAKRLFQANSATAFNNLDKQLVTYIGGLAGSNKVDKNAIRALLKQVNGALAELGPTAYTKEGQQKVRKILTVALETAHKIVSGGTANAGDTASAINQLTNQYLYNIMGKELPGGVKFASGSSGGGGASARAQHAVKTALAQLGDPYAWGAEGPGSFDCSGLTQYAAKKAGVNIPRVADDQFRKVPRVKSSEIKPGDLIFPEERYVNGKMEHVMMYIGDGKCVHAPRPGKSVEITDLPSSFAAGRYA